MRRTGQHRPLGSGSDSLNDFAQRGEDPAALEDLGRGIHQGKPDLPFRGPHLADTVVRPQLLHLVESGGGEVLDNEAVAIRTGTTRGSQGLLLEEEDRSPEGLVGESDDKRRGVGNSPFVLGVAVDAEALLNDGLELRDRFQVAFRLGHCEDGLENLVIGIFDRCFVAVFG